MCVMAVRKRKLIAKLVTTKEIAKVLKVSPEVITYLRQSEGLPFIKNSKYILFSESEVLRWRNKRLANDSKVVLNLKTYYMETHTFKFIPYDEFKKRASEVVFLDGNNVIQYLKRQNPVKDIQNLLGDIVSEFWASKRKKCNLCGRFIVSTLDYKKGICATCKKLTSS